ncbi:hypothetical protein ABPG72_014708 [Tetrahymena utriculariae]
MQGQMPRKEQLKMIFTDTFQVGFIFYQKDKNYNLERTYIRYIISALFPQIILDSFMLFGRNVIFIEVIPLDAYLAYLILLGQLVLVSVMITQIEFTGYEYLLKYIQIIFTSYLSTFALIQISNYFLLLSLSVILLSLLITFYIIKSKDQYKTDLLKQFTCILFMIPFARILYCSLIQKKYITIILYHYTFLRLLMLFIFGVKDFVKNIYMYDQISNGLQIVLINQFFAFISSLLQLIFDFHTYKTCIYQYKIFFIYSKDSLQDTNNYLKDKCEFATNIEIYLVSKGQIISTLGYNQLQNYEICKCSSNFCKLHYELIKNMLHLIKKGVQIQVKSFYDYPMCSEQQFLLLQEEENLPEYYFNTFKIQDLEDKYLFSSLVERYFNGFLYGELSNYIFKLLNRTSKQKIKKLKSSILCVNAFLKQLKNEINFLPYQLVLYDLNEI